MKKKTQTESEKTQDGEQAIAGEDAGVIGAVKGKQHQNENRNVQNGQNQSDVGLRKKFHTSTAPSSSEKRFMIAMEMRIKIIMTKEMDAPTL